MNKSDSIAKLSASLAKAQSEMPVVSFDAINPFLKNKYASLGSVIHTSRPILAKHGLSVIQFPIGDSSNIGIESALIHESGEFISDRILIPLVEEKGKSKAQCAGSTLTYLRRYSWASLLGMYADEDTDGNSSTLPPLTQTSTRLSPPPFR